MRTFTAVLLMLSSLTAWAADAPSLDFAKATKEYLKADANGRTTLLAGWSNADRLNSAADVKKWTQHILTEIRKAAGPLKLEKTDMLAKLDAKRAAFNKAMGIGSEMIATLPTPGGPMRVVVLEGKGKASPALISLHGGGNVGGDHPGSLDNEMAWGWGLIRTKMIPSVPFRMLPRCIDDKATNAWILESEAQAVEAALDAIVRREDIDQNRLYLMGTSMGGFGTWKFASIMADRFAGIASLSGGCTVGEAELSNLRNTVFNVYIGEKDSGRLPAARKGRDILVGLKAKDADGYKMTYKEYPNVGHELSDGIFADVDAFFKATVRVAAPRIVVWNPTTTWRKRFYNLGIDAPAKGMEVRAEMGADNTITITSKQVSALTLYLNDRLVDFKKPVKVVCNGKEVFAGEVQQHFAVLLETLEDRCDAEMCYTVKISVAP